MVSPRNKRAVSQHASQTLDTAPLTIIIGLYTLEIIAGHRFPAISVRIFQQNTLTYYLCTMFQ
jgi:hypothetical protein